MIIFLCTIDVYLIMDHTVDLFQLCEVNTWLLLKVNGL